MNEEIYKAMAQSIIDGEPEEAEKLAIQAVEQGLDPLQAINEGFVPGVDYVGNLFSCGDVFLPDLVMAGEAMKAAVSVLEPEMIKQGTERKMLGTVVIGTIEGDIHDIGKMLVGTMLSASGFKVIDLGVDVPAITLVEKAREESIHDQGVIIGISSLLTTTMVRQRDVIEALEDMGLRDSIKVMVGGAPVTRDWVEEIGADGFSEDATGAVAVAKELLKVA
ncbi:MAG: corrinoid protein [Candidatus Promineifilaceae bacterium]|jgi:corrinoid protein of di/trimethylamine methyltransferase